MYEVHPPLSLICLKFITLYLMKTLLIKRSTERSLTVPLYFFKVRIIGQIMFSFMSNYKCFSSHLHLPSSLMNYGYCFVSKKLNDFQQSSEKPFSLKRSFSRFILVIYFKTGHRQCMAYSIISVQKAIIC